MAGNTLQSNPSDPTENFEQPDWNTTHGDGVEPSEPVEFDFAENFEAQRAGAQERVSGDAPEEPEA